MSSWSDGFRKGLLPNVNSRTSASASVTRAEAGGLDERAGAGEAGEEPGWAGVRLCNLVAQSSRAAKGTVPARGRKRAYRERNRALGDYLFQTLQKPDPGHRAGSGNSGADAGKRSFSRLLPGNDLRGFFGGSALAGR